MQNLDKGSPVVALFPGRPPWPPRYKPAVISPALEEELLVANEMLDAENDERQQATEDAVWANQNAYAFVGLSLVVLIVFGASVGLATKSLAGALAAVSGGVFVGCLGLGCAFLVAHELIKLRSEIMY